MLNFLRPPSAFFDLFDRLALHVATSAEHLRMYARTYPGDDAALERIREDEHEADKTTHELLARLDRNFQTPVDRDDMHALAGDLDNIVDDIDALAKRFPLFHVGAVEPKFFEQTEVLVDAGRNVKEAVGTLRERKLWPEMIPRLIEIHRLERVGDENHYSALSRLFDGTKETLFVVKWKTLYDLIEEAIDDCQHVAKTLRRIMLKNA